MRLGLFCVASAGLLLAGCQQPAPEPAAADPAAAVAPAAARASNWQDCLVPGANRPIAGKLFVIDGGQPTPEDEAGRESIRRVEVNVPGPVSLLLTAREGTVWLVRASPETQVQAVFASGEQPQRITGQNAGNALRAVSKATGEACGRYWLDGGAGPALGEVTQEIFGRPHDAIYTMRIASVVIGGPESMPPDD